MPDMAAVVAAPRAGRKGVLLSLSSVEGARPTRCCPELGFGSRGDGLFFPYQRTCLIFIKLSAPSEGGDCGTRFSPFTARSRRRSGI